MSDVWHILGRGAIGLLWAGELNRLGQKVELIVKNNLTQTQPRTVTLKQISGTTKTFQVNLSSARQNAPISNLVVPLKAYDVLTAIEQIQHRLTAKTLIILCHNGMGTIEPVQQLLGKQHPLLFATTTHGAMGLADLQVEHTGLGETKMGWVGGKDKIESPELLQYILEPVSWDEDINRILWRKLAINCVINPLTAVEGCHNGQLAQPQYQQQIRQICQEISLVANTCGIDFDVDELTESSYKVIQGTAQNLSSMNRDIAAGRPSEIDFITGYLLKKGTVAGLQLPVNQALYDQVKALELRRQPPL